MSASAPSEHVEMNWSTPAIGFSAVCDRAHSTDRVAFDSCKYRSFRVRYPRRMVFRVLLRIVVRGVFQGCAVVRGGGRYYGGVWYRATLVRRPAGSPYGFVGCWQLPHRLRSGMRVGNRSKEELEMRGASARQSGSSPLSD